MKPPAVVSRQEWLAARRDHMRRDHMRRDHMRRDHMRRDHMRREKELTRQRDALAAERRRLPWVKLEKTYTLEAPGGSVTLADLFDGREQLVVYHFMLGPDWEEGCKSCSFWADGYDGTLVHLAARDVRLTAVSRAPLEKIEAFRQRMGWSFPWVSSHGSDFDFDFGVSFTPEQRESDEKNYDFGTLHFGGDEAPGLSVFARGDDGAVYHTYSTYSRGLDVFNATYQILDLVPKGRDEDDLEYSMSWLRLHDAYPAQGAA